MLSKDQTEVLKSPPPDAATDMLLAQDGGQNALEPAPASASGGGMNDPPVGT